MVARSYEAEDYEEWASMDAFFKSGYKMIRATSNLYPMSSIHIWIKVTSSWAPSNMNTNDSSRNSDGTCPYRRVTNLLWLLAPSQPLVVETTSQGALVQPSNIARAPFLGTTLDQYAWPVQWSQLFPGRRQKIESTGASNYVIQMSLLDTKYSSTWRLLSRMKPALCLIGWSTLKQGIHLWIMQENFEWSGI